MTTHTPHQLLVGVVFAASLVVCGANQTAEADDLTIFVALTDSEGEPVTDLAAKDFAILWDGVACDILEIEPLNRPVRVTVYFDNATESVAALPDMREGVRLFLDALPPDIEVAIGSIAGRPQLRSPYTTDREELLDAIGKIAPEGGSATFWDALYEEAERIDKDEDRQYTPVIVMVAVGGPEASSYARSQPFERGMERLFANGATVHTLLFTSPSGVGRQTGRNQSAWGADIAASTHGRFQPFVSSNANGATVHTLLFTSPSGVGRQTGRNQSAWGADIAASTHGRFQPFVSNAFRTLLPELAKDLARKNKLVSHQFRVTYTPPKDASDQARIQLQTKRAGLIAVVTENGNIP